MWRFVNERNKSTHVLCFVRSCGAVCNVKRMKSTRHLQLSGILFVSKTWNNQHKVNYKQSTIENLDPRNNRIRNSIIMAQSEAGKSTKTVPNEEEEEEFGPQLITKLEVRFFCRYFLWSEQHWTTYFTKDFFCLHR